MEEDMMTMTTTTSSRPTRQEPDHDDHHKPTNNTNTRSSARFICHLHPDILYRIASKLPPKEFARTSILSSDWTWSACPRLTFDAVAICKCTREDLHKHNHFLMRYINEVTGVLHNHQDKVVETLEVKVDFVDSELLARHIDAWVQFSVSSRTKNLTLDLKPERFFEYNDLYVFPFQLLDRGSISRLQHVQLSFVCLNPPSWFKGFPNLRKLHLQTLHINRKDLENMLSRCCTLEWLCIDRCRLDDELIIVDSPLPRLLYLRVQFCLTKIKFNAVNLVTFEYDGEFIPIDLVQSFKLQSANIRFKTAIFQHALISLLNGLPSVQSLTLQIRLQYIQKQWLWDNPLKFTNLKYLQWIIFVLSEDVDKVLYSLAFLRATPFIEKLEVHFAGCDLWLAKAGPCRKDLGQCKYVHLKHIWISGFRAARGQLEFLLHVIENAPELEILLVEIGQHPPFNHWLGHDGPPIKEAMEIARTCIRPILLQNVTFDVKE